MRSSLCIIIGSIVLAACAAPSTDARLSRAEVHAYRLAAGWAQVSERLALTKTAYDEAATQYARCKEKRGAEAGLLKEASRRYDAARRRWQQVEAAILAAAFFDGRSLEAARTDAQLFSEGCDLGMSTTAYRALLEGLGIDLLGFHVDHIVPRALGGADHPANYQILPSSLNESLGASWNADKCALAGASACRKAVEVSRACGSFEGAVP